MVVPLLKPSRLKREKDKWERRVERDAEKAKAERQAARKWAALSALIKHRDGESCRACGRETVSAGNPEYIGSAHHIVYRSAGGTDDPSNLIWVCAKCHDDEHLHKIRITGTAAMVLVANLS